MANLPMVAGLIFLLFFIRFFFNWYDLSLTQMKRTSYDKMGGYASHYEDPTFNSTITGYNETIESPMTINWWDLITKTRYENVPDWFVYMIYVPILAGLIYVILPIPFKV